MNFRFPNLQPLEVIVEEYPPEAEPKRVGFLPGANPIDSDGPGEGNWIAQIDTAFESTWRPEMPRREDLYFPSPEAEAAHRALIEYLDERRCSGFLSAETGLPTFIFGDLDRDFPGANDDNAASYLERFQLIFGGRTEGIQLTRVRKTQWDDQTFQVVFQQTNSRGAFVYGAQTICTYDSSEHLSLVTSSLFPITGDELPTFSNNALAKFIDLANAGLLDETLAENIPSHIGFQKLLTQESEDTPWPVEFWVLPIAFTQDMGDIADNARNTSNMWSYEQYAWRLSDYQEQRQPDPDRAAFYAAYRVPFFDQYDRCWAAWLSADDLSLVLKIEYLESHALREYEVFPTTTQALDDAPSMEVLSLGPGATTLRTSPKIRLDGVRLFDPLDAANPQNPVGGGNDIRRFLGANVYYHTWETQYSFSTLTSVVLNADDALVNQRYVNPLNQVAVFLDDAPGDPVFNRQTGEIHFRTGDAGAGFAVAEPGKDGEVIAHEFTHAVMHFFFPELLEHDVVNAWIATGRGLDEALAFYFACSQIPNPLWGEFAYEAWGTTRYLNIAPDVFAPGAFGGDPAGGYYGYAIWWARILWRLSQKPALNGDFNRMVLKALRSLAGRTPVADPAAAGNLVEEIRSAFNQFGAAIYVQAKTPAAQTAIRDVLKNVGLQLLN